MLATVRDVDGRLEVQSPRRGRFFLNARSPTAFVVEDALWRLEFMPDGEDGRMKMRVWFQADDAPFELVRVP